MTFTHHELERATYISGDARANSLYAEIQDLDEVVCETEDRPEQSELDDVTAELLAYKEFFDNCFQHLGAHYPAPSVTNDYDCGVIYAALARDGEREGDRE